MRRRSLLPVPLLLSALISAAIAAGPTAHAMAPKTAIPIVRSATEAPPARVAPNHPHVAPPTFINRPVPVKRSPVAKRAKNVKNAKSVRNVKSVKNVKSTKLVVAKKTVAKRACSDINQCSYVDRFKRVTDRWLAADGYANGNPFDAWWSKHRAVINLNAGELRLSVGRTPRFGKNHVAGQLQSTRWHGYGCYEVRMKPATQQGLISTFFTYTGRYDKHPGATSMHNEVDIEFVYRAAQGKFMMQANYFTNGRGGNEHFINLPFAPERRFHNYGFRWGPRKIEWYVDGRKVYTATRNIPQASNGNHKIMMNFWPVQDIAAGWGGYYQYGGPRTTMYRGVRFTRGANCRIQNRF